MKLKSKKNPYILGHRGASGYAPENTLEAFKMALDMGADGIELDVQITKDGQLVVIHDEQIDRTSNGKGLVRDYTLDELRKFNFNNHMDNYEFCQIPTFEEVLQLFCGKDRYINAELKTGIFEYPGIEKQVIEMVHKYNMQDYVFYSSFNFDTMERCRQIDAECYIGLLYDNHPFKALKKAIELKANALHPHYCFVCHPVYMLRAKIHGIEVNSWTINKSLIMRWTKLNGVKTIITNYPNIAIEKFK